MDIKISLARMYYPVKVLGPGRRVGIWLNGCRKNCSGCISPELKVYDPSKEITVDNIISIISTINDRIDGFTISGGEPFFNPIALKALVQALSAINDDILIFTGLTFEELKSQNSSDIDSVLCVCAAIVDGPYIKELKAHNGLRGSTNQRLLVFKYHDRYKELETADRSLQTIVYNNSVLTIGIP